ncbi:TonB-dependent receptor [Hyphomonas polymorpha PS728]|uniref:TonB-dependent receptor n=1 Tax=Hyphomonas polymorpha PS728 TaxID=1280954 RepID=A0A062VFA3_9PROT|nr:TonB-dependent receptor [Hyphomonas polymorpha]KCZ99037.1 TonB-dependent receptor [Hyphomonas polymorpha PS728]
MSSHAVRAITGALLGAASLNSLSFAYAQSTEDESRQETITITASRLNLAPREIGSAIAVVDRAALETGQIIALKETLQDIPGVQISAGRPGGSTNVSIRGSDNDQVLFLFDGIKLGDPSSTSTQFSSDNMTSLDVERIEVLRGNQSSLYGSDAIGGVINIITQRATEEGIRFNVEAEAGGYLGVSSEHGDHLLQRGGVSLLGKQGKLDYRLSLTGTKTEGPSIADPRTGLSVTEDDDYSVWAISGRAGYQFSETLSGQVVGFYNDSSTDLDNTTSDSVNTVDKKDTAYAVQLTHETPDSAWKNELTLSRYNAERLYFGPFYSSGGDLYDGTKDTALFITRYTGFDKVQISAGLNWEDESTDQVTLYSGNFSEGISTTSVFTELAFRPTEALSITVAGRLDDNERFGQFDTYRVTGAYYLPATLAGGDVKLRASYGTGAKAPGLYQLFDPTYGNAGLKVETSEGYDAGVDISWARAALEFSVFHSDVEDEIAFGYPPGKPSGGYIQFGRTKKQGAELGLRYSVTDWLSLSQSFMVLDAQNEETGLWLGRPRYSGTTSATAQLTDRFDLTTRLRYRSDNASSYGGVTPGFVTLDLLGNYDLTSRVALYGRLVNALDQDYQLSYGRNELNRSLYLGVRARF